FGLGRGFLARRPLYFLPFESISNRFRVHYVHGAEPKLRWLSLLQPGVFFNQLLQPVAREADRDLSIIAFAFAPDHCSGTVLRMLDCHPGSSTPAYRGRSRG